MIDFYIFICYNSEKKAENDQDKLEFGAPLGALPEGGSGGDRKAPRPKGFGGERKAPNKAPQAA